MCADVISRPNYFSGETLLTADFQAEQSYHKEMREHLSTGAFTPGILEGLEVTWTRGGNALTVTTGKALDANGRLIVLPADQQYTPQALVDGDQNFLTIQYLEQDTDPVSDPYAPGYKRVSEVHHIDCSPTYDPTSNANEVLLAVISASGGSIDSVYYYRNAYMRKHVSATLRSVEFAAESTAPPGDGTLGNPLGNPSMHIAATSDAQLEIQAPAIKLSGDVTADSIRAATFTGAFSGNFQGDGSQLTNLPNATNYWTQDAQQGLFYTAGNVGIGTVDTTEACLTIQGNAVTRVATGLVSLIDPTTLIGYQTRFTQDVTPGQILSFASVPEQTATVDQVLSDTALTIKEKFAIDLGPTTFSHQRGSGSVQSGSGTISAEGTQVTGQGTTFQGLLASGDKLIIASFEPAAKRMLRVQSVVDDTTLKVVAATGALTSDGPKTSAFSVSSSVLLVVGGTTPPSPNAPQALVVTDNGGTAQAPNTVAINMNSGDFSGDHALVVGGKVKLDELEIASIKPAATAPIALDGDAVITGQLSVDGNLNGKPNGPLTIGCDLEVAGQATIDGNLEVKGQKAKIDNDLEVGQQVTIDGNLEVKGPTATIDNDLNVTKSVTIGGDLKVQGGIKGTLTAPLQGPVTVDGLLTVAGDEFVQSNLTVQKELNVIGSITTLVAFSAHQMTTKQLAAGDSFQVSENGDISSFGKVVTKTYAVGHDGEQVTPLLQAQTDGFVLVSVDPDTFGSWNGTASIRIDVNPVQGDTYTAWAPVALVSTFGRLFSTATVPLSKGSSCSLTFKVTSNTPAGAQVAVSWVPVGQGDLHGFD